MIGAGVNYFGQQQTNQMQAEMQQQQMAFQERMSSTAYQRASTDMQKAGLNPMMMFGSGGPSSSPAGAPASPVVKSGLDADAVQKGVATATQALMAEAQVKNIQAQTNKTDAETLSELQRPSNLLAERELTAARTITEDRRPDLLKVETDLKRAGIPIVQNEAVRAEHQKAINSTARRLADQGSYLGEAASATLRPVSDIVSTALGARKFAQPGKFQTRINTQNLTQRHEPRYGDTYQTNNIGGQ